MTPTAAAVIMKRRAEHIRTTLAVLIDSLDKGEAINTDAVLASLAPACMSLEREFRDLVDALHEKARKT